MPVSLTEFQMPNYAAFQIFVIQSSVDISYWKNTKKGKRISSCHSTQWVAYWLGATSPFWLTTVFLMAISVALE